MMKPFKTETAAQELATSLTGSLSALGQDATRGRERARGEADALASLTGDSYQLYQLLDTYASSSSFHTRELLKSTSITASGNASPSRSLQDTFLPHAFRRMCGHLLPYLEVPNSSACPWMTSLLSRYGVATDTAPENIIKGVRIICAQLEGASSSAGPGCSLLGVPPSVLLDVMSSLYSALSSHLSNCEETTAGAGLWPTLTASQGEGEAGPAALFRSERLIFGGCPDGNSDTMSASRGCSTSLPAGNQPHLGHAPILHTAAAPPDPAPRKQLLLRTSECVWEDCLCAAACGLQPLRSAYPSLRPFFVESLGVAVMNLALGARALRALAETPWHLMQDRLAGTAGRRNRHLASVAEAGIAILEEMEQYLRQAGSGGEPHHVMQLEHMYMLAQSKGGSGQVTKLVPAKQMCVYIEDSSEVARRLDSAVLIRAPRHKRSLWLAVRRWTPENWMLTRALPSQGVLLSLRASAVFGLPKIWAEEYAGGQPSPPRVVREEALEALAR